VYTSLDMFTPIVSTGDKKEPIPSLKINFPDRGLKDKFKATCALNSKNMNEVIIDFVRRYVAENETSTPKTKKGKDAA